MTTAALESDRDYRRIAAAIRYLEEHRDEQPGLEDLARHLGLSPYHVQRTFRRWAGTTPKRFLQFLTAEEARRSLRAGEPVLAAAFDAGLSSPGRLHDLLVTLDAMTPGEVAGGGAGLALAVGVHPSPFGPVVVATTGRGVALLRFVTDEDAAAARELVAGVWPGATLRWDPERTGAAVAPAFTGDGAVRLHVAGTNLQLKVWEALLRIPPGRVATYGAVAAAVGRPDAVRAVASAVGRNPVAYLIPCHRVLRADGRLGGYAWGTERKRLMLAREAAAATAYRTA